MTIAADPAEVVARVLAPRVEEVEAPVAVAEGEEAAAPADEAATPAEDES